MGLDYGVAPTEAVQRYTNLDVELYLAYRIAEARVNKDSAQTETLKQRAAANRRKASGN
jgi:hypothetical protein